MAARPAKAPLLVPLVAMYAMPPVTVMVNLNVSTALVLTLLLVRIVQSGC